jgi:hypothetical protein
MRVSGVVYALCRSAVQVASRKQPDCIREGPAPATVPHWLFLSFVLQFRSSGAERAGSDA